MNITLLERDVKQKERRLKNLEYALLYSKQKEDAFSKLLSYEVFFLKDQLERCRVVFDILLAEHGPVDEMHKSV